MAITTRLCRDCGIVKSITEYHKTSKGVNGFHSYCKSCRALRSRNRYYKDIHLSREKGKVASAKHREHRRVYRQKSYVEQRYGVSVEELNYFVDKCIEKNGMKCEVCGRTAEIVGRIKQTGKRRLVVDHNHKIGQLRGMLCDLCNTALGKLGDSIPILKSAIIYLEKENYK